MQGMRESRESTQVLELAEREGFEPEAGTKRISNLLSCLEILSPPLPSNPRIWHSIWH